MLILNERSTEPSSVHSVTSFSQLLSHIHLYLRKYVIGMCKEQMCFLGCMNEILFSSMQKIDDNRDIVNIIIPSIQI